LDSIRRLRFHEGHIFSISLFPETRMLATAGSDRRLYLTTIEAKDSVAPAVSALAHDDAICCMISDGHCLLWSASADGQLKQWKLEESHFLPVVRMHGASIS